MKFSKKFNNRLISIILAIFIIISLSACSVTETTGGDNEIDDSTPSASSSIGSNSESSNSQASQETEPERIDNETDSDNPIKDSPSHTGLNIKDSNSVKAEETERAHLYIDGSDLIYNNISYSILDVDGGNKSGSRKSNVAVDIGFGDRVYWGLTNEYGQLVIVIADKIILQDDNTEPVNSSGRYYDDEAAVPGTEHKDLDQGHVIADSLGGVSNAYNITPQDSNLNRHGDQAYMEKVIRDAGGCENFVATISYNNPQTQIPSHYHFEYDLMGNHIVDDFDNINPDDYNATHIEDKDGSSPATSSSSTNDSSNEDLSSVDTNGNGKVTIAEAKAAGYKMPITSNHWLYKYMTDRDNDGMVGE